MATEEPDTFLVDILGDDGLNLTVTTAPTMNQQTDYIEVNLDGRIYDHYMGTNHVGVPSEYIARFDRSHPNQVFLHENFFHSAYFLLRNQIKRFEVEDEAIGQLLTLYFPELKWHFGDEATYGLQIELGEDVDI